MADFFESVLRNEFRVHIGHSIEDTDSQAVILMAYVVLASLGASRENPNVDLECERAVGGVLQPRLKKWASAARSSDREDRLFERGAKTIMAGANYQEGLSQIWTFVFENLPEDYDGKIPSSEFANLQDALLKAESRLVEAVSRHDSSEAYQDWIDSKVVRREAEEYGKEMAGRLKTHIQSKYQIDASSEALKKYEEAVVGIFFLCTLPRFYKVAEEGRALWSTLILSFRQALEGLPDDDDLSVVTHAILMRPNPGKKEVNNIVSWAIAHSRDSEFNWGDDWTMMDYSGGKSLMSVFGDALDFHGV